MSPAGKPIKGTERRTLKGWKMESAYKANRAFDLKMRGLNEFRIARDKEVRSQAAFVRHSLTRIAGSAKRETAIRLVGKEKAQKLFPEKFPEKLGIPRGPIKKVPEKPSGQEKGFQMPAPKLGPAQARRRKEAAMQKGLLPILAKNRSTQELETGGQIYDLRVFQGLAPKQIADTLRLPEVFVRKELDRMIKAAESEGDKKTVKKIQSRGRKKAGSRLVETTHRQNRMLQLAIEGKTPREIAKAIGIPIAKPFVIESLERVQKIVSPERAARIEKILDKRTASKESLQTHEQTRRVWRESREWRNRIRKAREKSGWKARTEIEQIMAGLESERKRLEDKIKELRAARKRIAMGRELAEKRKTEVIALARKSVPLGEIAKRLGITVEEARACLKEKIGTVSSAEKPVTRQFSLKEIKLIKEENKLAMQLSAITDVIAGIPKI